MQPVDQWKDNIFMNPTKVDSSQKDLWLFLYELTNANNGSKGI
jgi:hypothetical protein